jgi:Zn-dependent protease
MDLLDPIVWYIVFVISVTVHEAAHATFAYFGGDPTAYRGGQVSLNPVPHMRREPIGMLVVPLLTAISNGWPIGWASAPYDPRWEQRHPRRAAWMAAAGPGANLALAVLALIGLKIGLASGAFYPPDSVGMAQLVAAEPLFANNIGRFLSMLLTLNVLLAVLNLIPVPPLDGASAVTLFMSEDLALRFKESLRSPVLAFGGLIAVFLFFGKIFPPIFSLLLKIVHPGVAYG